MSFRKDTVSGDIFLQFCFFPFLHRHFLAQHSRWDVRPWSSVSFSSPPIKAATECNSLAPYRHLKKTMHILNTVRHFSLMVLMRRSYLIAKTLILYRKVISLIKETENSQVPFDILFLNAIKNTTKLNKTKL